MGGGDDGDIEGNPFFASAFLFICFKGRFPLVPLLIVGCLGRERDAMHAAFLVRLGERIVY